MANKVDPITLEVMRNNFVANAEEMATVLMRWLLRCRTGATA